MSSVLLIRRLRHTRQPSTPTLAGSKVLLCVMPIVQIAIGAVYLHDCPRQHYIPIYLIVLGVFSLVLALLSCLPCAQDPNDGTSSPLSYVFTAWNSLVSLFLLCWFITGSVWIYSIYQPNYDEAITEVHPYCNRRLYLFAFWTTTVAYILLALLLVVGCFVLMCGKSNSDDDDVVVPGP
uniref:Si:dkey-19b23.12 n=1 Tax=Amphiprion percula TaxID=161767 RepID=A0A3P8SDT0_AMPPE